MNGPDGTAIATTGINVAKRDDSHIAGNKGGIAAFVVIRNFDSFGFGENIVYSDGEITDTIMIGVDSLVFDHVR